MSSQSNGHQLTSNWAVITAILFSAFIFAASLYISAHRLLWYDEILTDLVSRQSWPSGVVQSLRMGVDQQPLPYYLIEKLSQRAFGTNALALRLPSALALFAGLLVTFDCARRLTSATYGLLALALLTCTGLPYYGAEARPYALFFMWTACSLWLWLHTPMQSRSAAVLFGLTVFATVASHFYGVFSLIPFGLLALLNIRSEATPLKLIAGCFGALAGLTLMMPNVQALHGALQGLGNNFWAPATNAGLQEVFAELFPHALILLSLLLIWVSACTRYSRRQTTPPMANAERLTWFFLLIPFAGFLVAKLVTNAFCYRYFICVLPGVAVGFSCIMWRSFRAQWLVPAGVLCLLTAFGTARCVVHLLDPDWDDPTVIGEFGKMREMVRVEKDSLKDGKHYLVLPLDSTLTIEMLYHSPHPDRYRLLDDPHSLIPVYCRVNKMAAQLLAAPTHLWHMNDLKMHAKEAALIEPPDKTILALQQMGVTVQLRKVRALQALMYLR